MPMHDWTRVPSGLFHDFHQTWSIYLKMALNDGLLPEGLSALVEQQVISRKTDDSIISEVLNNQHCDADYTGGSVILDKPRTKYIQQSDSIFYARKANRIVIRHHLGKVVAIIEIVSPGNKDSTHSMTQFVNKITTALYDGVHVMIVDLFPPGKRDPEGLHQLFWQDMDEDDDKVVLTEPENRLLASYEAGSSYTAYLETVGVGSVLPEMPLFIASGAHVVVPLETTYQEAWQDTPDSVRRLLMKPASVKSSD